MQIEKVEQLTEIAKEFHSLMIEKGFWDDTKAIFKKLNIDDPDGYGLMFPEAFLCAEEQSIVNAMRGQKLFLIASEVSEALERLRKDGFLAKPDVKKMLTLPDEEFVTTFKNEGKDTIGDELADVIYRIFDFCSFEGIDIGAHLAAKHRYNMTRPYKHGKKF